MIIIGCTNDTLRARTRARTRQCSAAVLLAVGVLAAGQARAQTGITSGEAAAGTLSANTTNAYTFSASAGDNVVLRLGTTGFDGDLNLYGPDGAFLKTAASANDAELDYTATNSGTFTAEVQSYSPGGSGTYVLHLAEFPGSFIVPAGEQGGPMTNGGKYAGTISLGDLNMFSFTANAGDNIVLRLGTTGFDGDVNLYGPDGAFLKTAFSATDAEARLDGHQQRHLHRPGQKLQLGGRRHLCLLPGPVPRAVYCPSGRRRRTHDQWRRLRRNGCHRRVESMVGGGQRGRQPGAAPGHHRFRRPTQSLRAGRRVPENRLLRHGCRVDWTATNSGTFTALVHAYSSGGVGTYKLYLAEFPEPFVVPPGDAGGPMTSGGRYVGTNGLDALSLWSVTANAGDNLVLRLGTTGFDGDLNLYGPDGAFLKTSFSGTDAELDWTATNSGTFTALVRSYSSGGVGTFALYLAEFPEPFIVPPGDAGGPMTNGGKYPGTISLGELDMWSFMANAGDNFALRLGTTGFDGGLSLYGPDGAFLKTAFSGTDAELDWTATNSGTFTALVRSYSCGTTGTYLFHLAQFPEPFIVPPGETGGPDWGRQLCRRDFSGRRRYPGLHRLHRRSHSSGAQHHKFRRQPQSLWTQRRLADDRRVRHAGHPQLNGHQLWHIRRAR